MFVTQNSKSKRNGFSKMVSDISLDSELAKKHRAGKLKLHKSQKERGISFWF